MSSFAMCTWWPSSASSAACQDGIHQIYVTQDECVKMEAFDLSLVGSEAQSAHCGAPDHGASLGHDTSWTLFVQILGVRRVSGASLWEGIAALFLSQLGQLVLLIAATTVQLRMYSSRLFAKYLDVFVEESEDVIFARAQRFATEFYCGAKLQELASRNRVKALVEKLARTKKKIQDLLRYNQEFMDSKSTGHSAAILKPANSKQVTEILKYAGEKNLTILPLMKEKNSAGKAVWNSASSQQLSEILKNAEKGKTGGEGVLHDELVLSVLRTLQLDPGEDEDKKAAIATIQDMLELRTDKSSVRGRLKYFINKSHEDDDVAIEELQLSCGLLKKDAEKVIKMFASNASIGKKYANLLQQITCGRLNPDGDLLRIQVQQLLDAVQVHQEISGQVQKRRNGLSPPHSSFSTASLKGVRSRTESDPSVAEEKEKGFEVVIWERIQGFIGPYLKAIADWWEGFKCSQLLGRVICDHAWLGLDEEHYRLNAINVTLDELCEHRRGNNLPRILWKAMLSNMPLGSALFCTLAFVMNRSLLDALRLLLVVFACLRSYPFPANWLWTFLKIYSTGVLVLRTLYDLPVVCAGFQLRQPRFPEAPRLMLEPEDSYQWCPVFTEIGIDILLGFAKRSTASSLEGTELWIDAVWADHLCIWAVLMHQWILQRYGVGRFVVFDAQSQRLWLRKQGDQCPAPSPLSSQEVRLKEENLGTWGSHFREDHKELVKHWWTLRQTFIREFEEQDELFHQYQEQFEEESSDSSSEAEQDPTDSGTLETTVSGEPEAEESAPRKPKMHRSSEVAQLSMSNMGGSSSARISRFRVRTGSVPSLDTALMLHSSKSVIAYEWIMEWAKARGRRVGLFASCKAPRDLEHIDPPRLLFPVLRSRENPEEEHEDQEEHRWNQALQWAQVLAYRFLSRQNRLYQRTGHRLGVAQDEQVIECEICTMFVEPNERHWSCGSCNYHICKNCANEIMQGRRPREKLMKLGISLYIAKYFLAFFLLCYALLNNKAILKEEERSFSQSLQENNFSVGTLLLIVAHMTILLSDRIFFKAHYSMRSHATLHIIELVNLGFILAEFVFLHYHTMAILWTSANPREATISLASDWELCIYYLCGMLYITICMMQIKHGLPALGTDSLRPKTIELFSPSSIYTEKLWYYFFLVHYNLPFVDDLRVIVDWTVVPTSLDLWMYWKVEDAHSSFYRSRHLMFVRGQSYYAEERDLLEKFYNGWAILCGVVLVILMPIIVFSPFSPFPNTVLVEHADMALGMTVASSCYGASRQQLCRYVELELFAAPALQIQRYNSSQTQKYLQDNPRVNTDIDIQDIKWPWFSKEAMHASPALVEEVQKIMDEATTGLDIAVVFELRYSLQRSVLGVSSHRRSLCSCAPSCGSFAAFPARVSELCSAGEVSFSTPMDEVVNQTRSWWREATESSSQEATVVLPKMWSPRVNLGNAGLTEKEEVTHFVFGLASEASRCAEDAMGLVSCARDRWGSLRNSNHSKVEENATLQLKVELEKSVNVQGVTGESTTYTTAMGLYVAVVWLVGKYLRAAFQGAAKQAIYDEIPDVHVFLDLIEAIKMAREHGDLRVEFELYYCLMQVLRSTHILLRIGGHEPRNYGIGRTDRRPPQAVPDGEVVHL